MKKLQGFTLIELMIVVAIIGILAAVAVPRFSDMLEKAREGATKGNAGAIKSAISIYYGDTSGVWPNDLTRGFSRYLDDIPAVKITHPGTMGGITLVGNVTSVLNTSGTAYTAIATNGDGWRYNSSNGDIWVNNSQTDLKGVVYSMYGYE
jgi:prepilin-type N-terminal cleavage/methylation domain-containing protein